MGLSERTEHKWTLWVCSHCAARAEWTGWRKSCGRCGSEERERVMLVRETDLRVAADLIRELRQLIPPDTDQPLPDWVVSLRGSTDRFLATARGQ